MEKWNSLLLYYIQEWHQAWNHVTGPTNNLSYEEWTHQAQVFVLAAAVWHALFWKVS